MTGIRQLEQRLQAWRGFAGIAGATRTLAAAQSLQWSEAARRAEAHLRRCVALQGAYPQPRPIDGAPTVTLSLIWATHRPVSAVAREFLEIARET